MTKHETMVETYKHKQTVASLMNDVIEKLQRRAINHDNSKLESFEVDVFTEYTPKLKIVHMDQMNINNSLKKWNQR